MQRSEPHVTLFRLDGCPVAADLRALFDGLDVAYVEVPLGPHHTTADACGYVSPTVRLDGMSRGGELLVQPPRAVLLDALYRFGLVPRRATSAEPDGPAGVPLQPPRVSLPDSSSSNPCTAPQRPNSP